MFTAQAKKVVLVVEDNAVERDGLASVLHRQGFVVHLASCGRYALDYLGRHRRPDLILLDMLMPGMDGWSFMGEKRRRPELAAVPVLVMTGIPVATAEWAADMGAQGFAHKPIDVDLLVREIDRCTLN